MSDLQRPVLFLAKDQQLQLVAAEPACQKCPAPCHVVATVSAGAKHGSITVSSGLLNRITLAIFGLPLLLIGALVGALSNFNDHPLMPVFMLLGVVMACALGGKIARKSLPQLHRALKDSGLIPNISRSG
ncbi:MAG: hypothetical protein GWP70_09150 [Proteobacteria bacterium]|nr:hypothetical protein [Pseudomonadota bacterium]